MSAPIEVRPAALADVPGLVRVHAGEEEGPWWQEGTCTLWLNHRLLRPFHLDVALRDREIVGYAEWIASREPEPVGHQLYLSMLQVRPDAQRQGVGAALVQEGLRRARALGCPALRTIPDDAAVGFYEKCGLQPEMETRLFRVAVRPASLPEGWGPRRRVPASVVAAQPMRFGWVQGSAAHMWELCNRPIRVAGEREQHPCVRRADGRAHVQLRCLGSRWPVLVVAWADEPVTAAELLTAACALAGRHRVAELLVSTCGRDGGAVERVGEETGRSAVWSRRTAPGPSAARA